MTFKTRARRPYGSPSEIASRAVNEMGGVKRAAFLLSRSPSAVSAWTLESAPTEIPYGAVQAASANGAHAFADDICAIAGGAFVPTFQPTESTETLIAQASEYFGRFISVAVGRSPNFPLHPYLVAQFRDDLDETIRALVAVRKCLIHAAEGEQNV